jgi:NAD+ kinase
MTAAPTPSPPLRLIVLALGERPQIADRARALRPKIEAQAQIVLWDESFSADLSPLEADLVVVMGGDGSILRAARQMGEKQRPVVGVNLGKLGFLAALSERQFLDILPSLARRKWRVVHHLMITCEVLRGGKVVASKLGLNEVAVLAGPPFRMLDVHLCVDGEMVTTYSSDGLIVSTPVGSTAHNLSAGGPILRKDIQALVISPISPHTLTNRPVVDSADRVYELVVASPNPGTAAVVDGQVVCDLAPGDRVRVKRAAATFQMIEVEGQSYYRTLRDKLRWGGTIST